MSFLLNDKCTYLTYRESRASSPFVEISQKTYNWTVWPAGSHCLSSLFVHYILNPPMPTEIISSLHKIQIIGEWHDLWKLKHLMADVKAQGEACFSAWFIPPDGWLAMLLDDGRHPHAYQPCNTVDILTSQSLFCNYFTHYGLRGAQPRPKHSVSWIRINVKLRTGALHLI